MWIWSLSGRRLLTALALASVTVRSLLAPSARRVALPSHGRNGYSPPFIFVPSAPATEGRPTGDGALCSSGRRVGGICRSPPPGGATGCSPFSSSLLLSSSSPPSSAARGDEAAAASDGTTESGGRGSVQADSSLAADGKKRSRTLYEILNVPPDATPVELKRGYVTLARLCHPDVLRRQNQEQDPGDLDLNFAEIAAAYRVLSNPKERLRYDRSLRAEEFGADAERKMTEITESAVQIFDEVALPFLERTATTTFNFDRAARANIDKVNKGAKWLSFRARREMVRRKRRDAEREKTNAELRRQTKGSEDTRVKHIPADIDDTDAARETRPSVAAPSAAQVEGRPSDQLNPASASARRRPPASASNVTEDGSQSRASSTTASSFGPQQPEAAPALWSTKDGISWSLASAVSTSSVTARDPASAPTVNVSKRDSQSFASSNSASSAGNATKGNDRSPTSSGAASSVAFQPPPPRPPARADDSTTVDSISVALFSLEEKESTPTGQGRSKSHDTMISQTRERTSVDMASPRKNSLRSTGSSAPTPDRTEQRLSRMWERVNKLKKRADALERSKGSYGRGREK